MHVSVLVLACLASMGSASRVKSTSKQLHSDLKSLAMLLRGGSAAPGGSDPTSRKIATNPTALFNTSIGSFKAELYLEEMPVTVSNFIDLASKGFFDGLSFHRVIPSFMAKFGCPHSRDPESPLAGTGGPDPMTEFKNLKTGEMVMRNENGTIPDEFIANISNEPGTLSMANTHKPNSGGSQFVINLVHNFFFDWFNEQTPSQHLVFGKITDGLDDVQRIVDVPRDEANKPTSPVIVESIEIAYGDEDGI